MTGKSLRLRLIAGGAAAIVVALSLAGVGLTILFERHITRTIVEDLEIHLKQLLAGVGVDSGNQLVVARPPADPRFADPLSGLYWQIGDDHGQLVRSRSLWDTTLSVPVDRIEPGEVHYHEATGPALARLMIIERRISLIVGGQLVPIRAMVGVDLARVSAAGAAFAKDLMIALAILGIVFALATSIQVFLGLRPLDALRIGIADIRSGRNRRLPAEVPIEVLPLVEEVNALLDAQDREIERSRGRAADLAHGLKTPLAALAADAGRLRERGETRLARDIEAVSESMNRHVDRELARVRLRGEVRSGEQSSTVLAPLARSLVGILSRTPIGEHIEFDLQIAADVTMPFDRTDLSEVLGNLLDNATRHAASQVRISAEHDSSGKFVAIEDDGEGVAPAARGVILGRGIRLDERGGEAGLGLAIVQDVLDAYGWNLALDSSELGGLKAICRPSRKAPACSVT